jgi:hypothetical protein
VVNHPAILQASAHRGNPSSTTRRNRFTY